MGLYENIRAMRESEVRTIGGVPFMPWSNPYWPFNIGGPVHPSREVTGVDQSLGLPALYSAVKILADSAASLPLRIYSKSGNTTSVYGGPTLFDQPTVFGTKFDWIFAGMSSLLLHGNAWGLITSKDKYGFPRGIEWLPPERVYVLESDQSGFNPAKTKVFFDGKEMKWFGSDRELFHIRAFTLPGRIEGISPLRHFAETITAGSHMSHYGLTWFQNGGFPPGVLQNAELEVDKNQADEVKGMLVASLRERKPLVLGRDWTYTPVTVPPAEAQFIDSMQLNATQIAAIYNLPPDRVGGKRGDSLTYNTVEQSTLQVIEALHPWLVRFEEAFATLLPGRRYVKFHTDALLRTDLKTRIDMYYTERKMGLRTTDEIREERDLAPLPGTMGQEIIPLDMMVSMSTRIGAVPKSMDPQIDFLMDHAAKLLVKLQDKGVAQLQQPDPATGKPLPPAQSPQAMLSTMVGAFARKYPEKMYDERVLFLREIASKVEAVTAGDQRNGAWIPNDVRRMLEE